MTGYAFLRSRRWAGIIALALIVALACALLGRWQFQRYEGKARMLELVEANYSAPAVPLTDELTGPFDAGLEWRPVEVTGRFVGDPVVLPQRGVLGSAGDHLLGVFEVNATGAHVVIDRGWIPLDEVKEESAEASGEPGARDHEPPGGEMTVTGRLRPAETTSDRGIRDHQVFVINPGQVLAAAGLPGVEDELAVAGYLQGVPGPAQAGLQEFPRPEEDLGPHLSYAFQWWIFSLGALVGLGVLARRESAMESGEAPPLRRRARDADEEDALIDAQLDERERP